MGKISWLVNVGVILILISPIILGLIVGIGMHFILDLFRIQIPLSWRIGLGIVAGFTGLVYLFKRITIRIPFGETWIIDRRGKIKAAEPGYHIILPFFGYDRIGAKINTRQYPIHLFPEMKEIWVDLKEGGEIMLHDPRIWIKVNQPLKTFTTAANFEEQLREMVENRLTGAINIMSYEEIMELRVPRALIGEEEKAAVKAKIKRKIDEIIQASTGIQNFLKEIGAEYKGFTLDDFDFDETTTTKRRERILTEMAKEIATNIGIARKNELSAIAKTAKVLKNAGFPDRLAQEIASERYQDQLAAEGRNLQKIVWPGMGIPQIGAQWEMGKKILRPPRKESERKGGEYMTQEEAEELQRKWREERKRKLKK
jgi:hypothetical protein